MFKKFVDKENVTSVNQLKSSVQRGMKSKIIEQFPQIESIWDEIVPKKTGLKLVKCQDHVEMLAHGDTGDVLFFKMRDDVFYPTLKLLHQYPFICPHQQVDKGAIKFILSGAHIMCPGLTSPGAKMSKVESGQVVAVMAEGKQHAVAIGLMKMSSEELKAKNKGIGVDNIHYLNDGLWLMKPVK